MTAIATTSPSSAAADEKRPAHKISLKSHAREVTEAAAEATSAVFARSLHASKFWQRSLNGPAPDRILVHPKCFYRKSLAEAELLIMGRFRLPGGDATARDGSPFFIQAPSELWSESLHSFHWLRHFDAGGSEPVQEHLRQLIAHWVRSYGQWHELSWRPHVLARRLITWASFGRLILLHADVLFRSAAEVYGGGTLAVVMTGMGQDGLRGCQAISAEGGQIVVQDEASSVVWGMPGFVARNGLADEVVPLDDLATVITRRATRTRPPAAARSSLTPRSAVQPARPSRLPVLPARPSMPRQ